MTDRIPLPPGADVYGYRVVRVLGVGGSALTYLAHQGPWDLPVALKEFFPVGSTRQPDGSIGFHGNLSRYQAHKLRFWREGQNLARFCHPGIVRVLHCFEHGDSAFLVQELLQGSTLKERMTGQPWPLEVVLQVAQDIGEALMVVHAGGLIHSDIKPDNLFATHDGRAVIIDFGLARSSEKSCTPDGRWERKRSKLARAASGSAVLPNASINSGCTSVSSSRARAATRCEKPLATSLPARHR